jgi:hypothetical protein
VTLSSRRAPIATGAMAVRRRGDGQSADSGLEPAEVRWLPLYPGRPASPDARHHDAPGDGAATAANGLGLRLLISPAGLTMSGAGTVQ